MVARKTAPEGFDIIIDDASHFGDLTKIAFWHLFDNHLKPSELYYRPRSKLYSGLLSLLRKLGVLSAYPLTATATEWLGS